MEVSVLLKQGIWGAWLSAGSAAGGLANYIRDPLSAPGLIPAAVKLREIRVVARAGTRSFAASWPPGTGADDGLRDETAGRKVQVDRT